MSTQHQLIINRSNILLKGVGVATFGLVALCYPGEAINTLLPPFGALVAINGAVAVFNNSKFIGGRFRRRPTMFRKGVVELLIGLAALGSVVMDVSAFSILVGLWVILTGSMQASNFYQLRDRMPHGSVMVAAGLLSGLFGLFMVVNAVTGLAPLSYEVSVFALLLGSSLFYAYAQLGEISQYLGNRPSKVYSLKTANA